MPRNRYIKLVRIRERAQISRQEKALIELARQLKRGLTTPIELPLFMTAKQRRSARLAQKRRYKPERQANTTTTAA